MDKSDRSEPHAEIEAESAGVLHPSDDFEPQRLQVAPPPPQDVILEPRDKNVLEKAGESIEKGSTASTFSKLGESLQHGKIAETAATIGEGIKSMGERIGEKVEAILPSSTHVVGESSKTTVKPISNKELLMSYPDPSSP